MTVSPLFIQQVQDAMQAIEMQRNSSKITQHIRTVKTMNSTNGHTQLTHMVLLNANPGLWNRIPRVTQRFSNLELCAPQNTGLAVLFLTTAHCKIKFEACKLTKSVDMDNHTEYNY